MKPRGSWYFEGYKTVEQPRKNGKGARRVLVYVGEYYGLPGGKPVQNRLKLQTALDALVCVAAYLYAQLTPGEGGMNRFVGLPGILALVPMIFLLIGLFNFLTAGEKWEIRVYYAGYRRMARWGIAQAILLGLWTLVEAGFVVMNLSQFLAELHYLLGALVSLAAALRLVFLVRKHPAAVVQGPKVE